MLQQTFGPLFVGMTMGVELVTVGGVRCNCVRHAILSTPDTFAYAVVSGAQKPSGGHYCTLHMQLCPPDSVAIEDIIACDTGPFETTAWAIGPGLGSV